MSSSPPFDPADCTPYERARAQEAAARLRLEAVRDPDEPNFGRAWDFLAAEFLARGELEERQALADIVRAETLDYGEGRTGSYHMIVAWEGDALVGVRDCYVDIDPGRGVALVCLSHCLVAPAWRRRGLAALLRAVPLALGRAVVQARVGRPLPTLVAAEMEPVAASDPASLVRLVAYGRSGFRVLDPRRLPYAQPDFRPGAPQIGIPLLGVVRALGIPSAEGPTPSVPVEIAAAYPILFHAAHRRYIDPARVDLCEGHALRTLRSSPEPVPLLPLPLDLGEEVGPLTREAVFPLYPRELLGVGPGGAT